MTFVLTIMKLNIDGNTVSKIVNVEARKVPPTSLENHNGEGQFICESDNDSVINRLLNDHEHVEFASGGIPTTTNSMTHVTIVPDNASEDVGSRAVASEDWKVRVRPALMRAASTISLFNA